MNVVVSLLADGQYHAIGMHADYPDGLGIVVPDGALADRRSLYNLASDADALAAIIQEHYARLNKVLPDELIIDLPKG